MIFRVELYRHNAVTIELKILYDWVPHRKQDLKFEPNVIENIFSKITEKIIYRRTKLFFPVIFLSSYKISVSNN